MVKTESVNLRFVSLSVKDIILSCAVFFSVRHLRKTK
jgi:hypothetical protein